jgi:hypothetical protein
MIRFVGFIPATVAFFTMSSIAHAQYNEPALGTGTKTVEIVIENATKGQVFSPGVFASHRSGVKLWAEGQPWQIEPDSWFRRENPGGAGVTCGNIAGELRDAAGRGMCRLQL